MVSINQNMATIFSCITDPDSWINLANLGYLSSGSVIVSSLYPFGQEDIDGLVQNGIPVGRLVAILDNPEVIDFSKLTRLEVLELSGSANRVTLPQSLTKLLARDCPVTFYTNLAELDQLDVLEYQSTEMNDRLPPNIVKLVDRS